jgi:hypothetical protein
MNPTKYTETDFKAALNARISNFEKSMDDLADHARATKERVDHVNYLIHEPEREIQNVARAIRENPFTFFWVGSAFALGLVWMNARMKLEKNLQAQRIGTGNVIV